MTPLAILPSWFPTEPLLFALVALIVAVLLMNRGLWWVVNIMAQDEPLLVAIGVFLLVGAAHLAGQLPIGSQMAWMAVGAVLVAVGLVARYTDLLDISELI